MPTRRRFLAALTGIAAAPFAARTACAQADVFESLVRQVTGGAPVNTGRVKLDIPRLADNGNSVPLRVSVENPMTAADYVRSVTLLSEKNPRPVMATFNLGPRAGRAEIATRVRLATTQRLLAVAQLSDGSYWSGSAEVEVTESACLDAS